METKFTPGRWHIDKHRNLVDRLGNNVQIKACLSVPIAGHTDEHVANAHLIAAAPEMYEMLNSMIEQFEYDGCTEYEFKLLASAKKTLAKARGEQ